MSICVRLDYFQETCYFPRDSDVSICLSLICDWRLIWSSRALRDKLLFCREPCYSSFKSIIDKLYGVFRRKIKQWKTWLKISSFSRSKLDSS